MFTWLTNRLTGSKIGTPAHKMAEQLYAAIVAQARQPLFYSQWGVADTIPGRFELITLHMFILLDHLHDGGEEEREVSQQLVDVMFQDMDDVARETGVGDMGVGPRIKKLARSFQSRLEYYKLAIDGDGEGAFPRGTLKEALIDIHYGDDAAQGGQANKLAKYISNEQARVANMSLSQIIASPHLFGDVNV